MKFTNFEFYIFLLLLLQSFIPEDVKGVIRGPEFVVNIFSYIPISGIEFYERVFSSFKFPLSYSALNDFGICSDGSIYNFYPMLTWLLLIIPLHIYLYFTKIWILRISENGCWKWFVKFAKRLVNKVSNMMTFGFYIRNIFELSQVILIFSIYEIYRFNTIDSLRIISDIFAIILVFSYLAFVCFIVYLIASLYKIKEDSHNKLGEFFCGIKNTKTARCAIISILIRKLIFVALLILLASISSKVVISIVWTIQFAYLIYVSYLRPFEEKKANAIQIINEAYFFVLLFALIFLNEENDWSNFSTAVYIWVLFSNTMIVFIISFGKLNSDVK